MSTRALLDEAALEPWAALLSEQELASAMRAVRFEDRRDRICARALLRLTLSQRAKLPPQAWLIEREPLGRPVVVGPQAVSVNQVSLAHSRAWVACAVGSEDRGALGVDLECEDRSLDLSLMLPEACDDHERAWVVRGGTEAAQRARFLSLWVLKEASLKASGLGLSGGLKTPLARAYDTDGQPLDWCLWVHEGVRLALVRPVGTPPPVLWTPQAPGHGELSWSLQARGRGSQGWPGSADGGPKTGHWP